MPLASPSAAPVSGMPHAPATDWRDYLALMKPRVMSLAVFTSLVGLVLAPGALHPVLALAALLLIAAGAGAAGALNCGIATWMPNGAHRDAAGGGRAHDARGGAGVWRGGGVRLGLLSGRHD